MKKTIYLKENDEPIWLELQKHCRLRGCSTSKKTIELIREFCRPTYDAIYRKTPYTWTREEKLFVKAFEGKTVSSVY